MAAAKRWKKMVKKAGRLMGRAVVESLEEAADEEYEFPEDRAEDVILRFPGNLIEAIVDWINERKRRHIRTAVRKAVLKRDGYQCAAPGCSRKKPLHIHHYKPVSEGGTNETGNLITLCANCHSLVHAGEIKIRKPRRVPVE